MSRVYLSSTFTDLEREREAAYRALRRLHHDAVAMEDYVAADVRPLDHCLADVRSCDIYVGLLGWRYGYIPPGSDRSITESELCEAAGAGKKVLLFFQDERLKPAASDPEDRRRIEALRAELGREKMVSFFSSPEDLAAKLTAAVANLFGEIAQIVGRLDMPLAKVLEAVKQIGETPKLSPGELSTEVDHLQRDAMNWVDQPDGLRTAQLRLTDARRLIAEAVKQDPKNADLLTLAGYVEKTQAQVCERRQDAPGARAGWDRAAQYLRAALELEPSNIGALNLQVNVFLEQRQYDKAAALGRLVTLMHPRYTAAFWDLGIALDGLLKTSRPTRKLTAELAQVYETAAELIPAEPSGFTPGDLEYARQAAARFRKLEKQLARQAPAPKRRKPLRASKRSRHDR